MSRLILLLLFIFCFLAGWSQRSFGIDKKYLDSLDRGAYKVFIVARNAKIDFLGRSYAAEERFTPDSIQVDRANQAIRSQYFTAQKRALRDQWKQMKAHKGDYDWKLAIRQHRRDKTLLLKSFKNQQDSLDNYDRYFYGYITSEGRPMLLIRFDPHTLTYFTIADEEHTRNLPLLVYDMEARRISVAG